MYIVRRPINAITSKPARRAYLQTIIFTLLSTFCLSVAVISYVLFYAHYIPRINVSRPIHLHNSQDPRAVLDLAADLVPDQPYDVTVHLRLPASPQNIDHGNFMVDIEVYDHPVSLYNPEGAKQLLVARRPGIMTYSSPLLGSLSTLFRLPLLLLGFARQEEKVSITLVEAASFAAAPRSAILKLDQGIHIYSATLRFDAIFSGVRWFMYTWRITSFLIFTTVFWGIENVWMVVVWWWLTAWLFPTSEEEREDDDEMSTEDETVEDVQRTFPRFRSQPPYPTPEPEGTAKQYTPESSTGANEEILADDEEETAFVDSGVGTMSEGQSAPSGRAQGSIAQRRRSRGAGSGRNSGD